MKIFDLPFFRNKSEIRVSCCSHPGLVRQNNEDSYLLLPQYEVWAVSDGMGGRECGEVASAIAVTALRQAIGGGADLAAAISESHRAIQAEAQKNPAAAGMGATVVAVQITADRYQVAWVGDSRAYLWHKKLQRLTKDHSMVQMMLDQGLIDTEEARTHPYRSVITQALGSMECAAVNIDTSAGKLVPGDILLLCSDGLNSEVCDDEIEAILASHSDLEEKGRQLLDAALAHGGKDNVTLILLAL